MPDPRSALPGARYEGLVTISEAGPCGMITLKGDLAAASLISAASKVAGVDVPGPGAAHGDGVRGICWMAPDELLLLTDYDAVAEHLATLRDALGGVHHLAADVSDARAVFEIEGEAARDVLGKLTPADLDPTACRAGTFRRTRLAQVPAAFWMREDGRITLIAFRSVAQYVFDLLSNAAKPGADPAFH